MATLEEALYSKLTGDATLMALVTGGVHNTIAFEKAPYPLLLFQLIGANEDYTFTKRVSVQYRYQVKAIAVGYDNEPCWAAMNRVDTLLTDATLTVTGYAFWRMRRTRQFVYAETIYSGKVYQHVGGEWVIDLAPA